MRNSVFAAVLSMSVPAVALAAEPGPLWGVDGVPPDPVWSETFYPVAPGAVRPRVRLAGETEEEGAALDAAWEAGIRTYLRRVSHMVAGMNLPDDGARMQNCAAMADLVHERFLHTEGRRNRAPDGSGGFAIRTKPQLERACAGRAFVLSGFYALQVRAVAVTPDMVQVLTCYGHDQVNDPLVKGGGYVFGNGRERIPRVSVETITRGEDGRMRIALHVAIDSDEALITGGCAAR